MRRLLPQSLVIISPVKYAVSCSIVVALDLSVRATAAVQLTVVAFLCVYGIWSL
jgi:hypothetical protein